ncbi:MAG: DUF3617 family protein [Gammaproteobacteria bacterium]|nr:DUF3617 family protein [Gammaproteobacteria bacterium]
MKPSRITLSLAAAVLTADFTVTAVAAPAIDMPKRKSGLWEIKTTMKDRQPTTRPAAQHCIDEKTDDLMRQSAKGESQCTQKDLRRDGNRLVIHSVCKFGQTVATSEMVFAGKFDSDYRADIHTTYEPPMMGMKEANMLIEAKWTGPCKPGMKPGDIIMPGMPAGMPGINMNEIMKRQQ